MYRFNKEMVRYLREDLGCRQLISAGNWRTVDALRLNDAERWSYTANEVMALNRFYNPVHLSKNRGWEYNNGDRFQNISVLFNPRSFPLAAKLVAGFPMMITETQWRPLCRINRKRPSWQPRISRSRAWTSFSGWPRV